MRVGIDGPLADRYELGQRLGAGGMGEVYEALDTRLDRPVAVKLLRPDLTGDPAMVARVEAEARLSARVHHPNVVAILDAGVVDGHPFIVMERLSGRRLHDRLVDAPLDEDEVRAIGRDILRGLTAAHVLKVIHRDVKPGNVLAGSDGTWPRVTWKVADFGIAKWLRADETLSATGEVIGSPSYLAPERIDGQPASPASDLFAVGVILYEALAGRRPVERDDPLATIEAIRAGRWEALETHRPDVAPDLRAAIERALALHPDDRWVSAGSFLAAIGEPGPAPEAEPTQILARPAPTVPLPVAVPAPNTIPVPDAAASTVAVPQPSGAREPSRSSGMGARARASTRRVLAVILGLAVAVLLLLAVLAFAFRDGDADPTPAPPAAEVTDVPEELATSLRELREAIEP